MTRNFALSLAILFAFSLATTSHAQTTPYGGYVPEAPGYGVSSFPGHPYGGFGLEYTQPVVAGSLVMDQYGLVYAAPSVESAPAVVTAQPQLQSRTRSSRSSSTRTVARPRYRLPTGSLEWAGGTGVILYSDATRYETYGSGYARGPYGVVDYSHMSKGWPLD